MWTILIIKFHMQDRKRHVMLHIHTMRIVVMKTAIRKSKLIK